MALVPVTGVRWLDRQVSPLAGTLGMLAPLFVIAIVIAFVAWLGWDW